MASNIAEYFFSRSSATLFHFAIDDGIYNIHGKYSTRYFPGRVYSKAISVKVFISRTVGWSGDKIVGWSYATDRIVDAADLRS